ncbi:MAG TPA: O-antigen polymerase [Blastocatellia bacterium]|nr:O-antigen polymerase [Blastocatellia bacterium]
MMRATHPPELSGGSTSREITTAGWFKGFLLSAPLWVGMLIIILYQIGGTPSPSKALVVAHVCVYSMSVIALLWMWYVRRRYYEDLGWVFLLVGHLAWFGLPALYQAVAPGIWFGDWVSIEIPNGALLTASLLISLFLFANGVGYHLIKRNMRKKGVVPSVPKECLVERDHRLMLVILIFLIGLIPYLLFGGSLTEVVVGVLAGRADKAWAVSPESGYEGNMLNTLFWLTRAFLLSSGVLSGCYLVSTLKLSRVEKAAYFLIFLLVAALVYFDQGTRSILLLCVVPVFVLYVLRRTQSGLGFSRSRLLVLGVTGASVLLALTQVQMYFRLERTRDSLTESSISELLSPRQQNDFFSETAIAVVVHDSLPHGELRESPLLFFVVNPIPRALWPNKPMPETMWHYSSHRWGVDIWDKGGNALPSVVGQYYIDWGIAGVLWAGLMYGMFAAWMERVATGRRQYYEFVALGLSGMAFMLISFRFLAPGFHYSTLILAVILLIYFKLNKRSNKSLGGSTFSLHTGGHAPALRARR